MERVPAKNKTVVVSGLETGFPLASVQTKEHNQPAYDAHKTAGCDSRPDMKVGHAHNPTSTLATACAAQHSAGATLLKRQM